MSKIPPMQAQALGLITAPTIKPVVVKTTVTKVVAKQPAKPAAAKPAAKPAAKAVVKAAVKAKPAAKRLAKPANNKKINVKKDDKKDNKKNDDKKPKVEKVKMERDSFTMPKEEYAQIILLKARLTAMGQPAKKSELLRAGIKVLAAMSDNTLKTTLAKIPVIKTGRPNKKS